MVIEIGSFYASDHENEDGSTETNVMLIVSERDNDPFEIESKFYVTETMLLIDGKFEEIYRNDWLPEFFKRKATEDEIELFKSQRSQHGELSHWSEVIMPNYLGIVFGKER